MLHDGLMQLPLLLKGLKRNKRHEHVILLPRALSAQQRCSHLLRHESSPLGLSLCLLQFLDGGLGSGLRRVPPSGQLGMKSIQKPRLASQQNETNHITESMNEVSATPVRGA